MRLAVARRTRLLTLHELAQLAGVSPKTINSIERGKSTPALSTIRKLSASLGVDPMSIDEFRAALEEKEPAPAGRPGR
ncbi:MAG TPA: helix-turn-helix transcriptional regulator [Dehalococcoidia bacterium]|nr:helix-turn-helix transcriptional regulator [Dehalococcoidia bacterium]